MELPSENLTEAEKALKRSLPNKKSISELNEVETLRQILQYTVASDNKLGTIKNIIVFVLVINIIGALVFVFSLGSIL